MIITRTALQDLQTGFRANFQNAFAGVAPAWNRIATEVPSSTGEEKYPWLGQVPGMREWIGPRQVKNLSEHGYAIRNKTWEQTLAVPRESIEDDQYGVYSPMFAEMGRAAAAHPDELVYALLAAGFTTNCYDGQFFFDTDHPVMGANDVEQSVSNVQAGAGAPWFLLDTSRAIKPLIFQSRKKPNFVARDKETDDNVFDLKEFRYGTDARYNVGFGFWQMAFASKATLDKANFEAGYYGMMQIKGDQGRPLGITPKLLVCGPSNATKAKEVVAVQRLGNGADNPNYQLVEVFVTPWLT